MRVVTYYRVSTAAQGRSGLGLEAQRTAVEQFCRSRDCHILAEFTEVESGKRNDRPELAKALHHAKVTGATLVIAKMDRLSRNAAFLMALQDSGAKFLAVDQPEADETTVGILAVIAQRERKATSERTKAALAAARERGTKLGNPNGAAALRRAGKGTGAALRAVKAKAAAHAADYAPVIAHLREQGHNSLATLAAALNEGGFQTPRGGRWHTSSVRNLLTRIEGPAVEAA